MYQTRSKLILMFFLQSGGVASERKKGIMNALQSFPSFVIVRNTEKDVEMKALEIHQTCPDCGVSIGEHHTSGCDVELCPFCGRQMIQDEC